MAALMIASVVTWARNGSGVLVANWQAYSSSSPDIGRSLFYGICIAFLGVTGKVTSNSSTVSKASAEDFFSRV